MTPSDGTLPPAGGAEDPPHGDRRDRPAGSHLHQVSVPILEGPKDRTLLGSDARVRGGTEGMCRLCGATTRLRRSHTVPKWAYRPRERQGPLHLRRGDQVGLIQDGSWHYLLCPTCEAFLGQAEEHLAMLSRGQPSELLAAGISVSERNDDGATSRLVQGADATLVMRALAGIFLKCHYAPTSPHVTIGKRALRVLRADLRADQYPPSRYAVHAIKWMDYGRTGMNPRGRIDERRFADGHLDRLHVTMGGVLWQLFCDFTAPDNAGALSSGIPLGDRMWHGAGPWPWAVADVRYSYAMVGPLSEMDHPDDTAGAYPTEDPCPCGRGGITFATCCSGTWA